MDSSGISMRRRQLPRLVSAVLVLAAIFGIARAGPANAAAITVNCTADPNALNVALTTASDGDTLSIQGTCKGTFEIARNLTLAGSDGATLDGQGSGTVLTVDVGKTVAISDLTITRGNGPEAGGILNDGTLALTNSTIRGNSATVASFRNIAGGILNEHGASLTLANSTVSGNTAGANVPFDTVVGGIANLCCGSTVTLTNSTVSGNSTTGTPSDAFGGILNSAPGDVVTLTNSTVSGNSASAPGGPGAFSIAVGGISNAGGSLTLTSSTLSGNSVNEPNGGFLPPAAGVNNVFGGTAVLTNSLVAGQSGGPNCYGVAAGADSGYNLDDGASCGFSTANHSLSSTNPLLDSAGLKDNGGPTQTIALLAGSPAVDLIPTGVNGCGTTITTDQRGLSRPQGSGCDIGSFELQPQALVVAIDIKPGESPNAINPRSNGTIAVGLLSTIALDAPSQIDASSLGFGRTGNEPSLASCGAREDVNGDGRADLVCRFTTQKTAFQAGDTQGILTGKTAGGTPIRGTDSVLIVPSS